MKSRNLKMLCCAVYFFSYLTRQNYAAALTEIIKDLDVSKSIAGIGITGSFISYGVFQIIGGFFGDKFKPEKIIFAGLFGSAFINIFVWLSPNIYVMNVLWCFNGAFQSLIWPPLVRLIVNCFDDEDYSVMIVRVTQASYGATVLAYLLVPAIVSAADWRFVFAVFGVAALLFSLFWALKTNNLTNDEKVTLRDDVNSKKDRNDENKKLNMRFLLSVGIVPALVSTITAGFMRDGISTWMPTYISEVYGLGSLASILTGAVIPVSCAVFLDVLKNIGEKIGNEMKTASLYFSIALASCVCLYFLLAKIPFFDIMLMSLITVCVHGVNLMFVGNVPKYFFKYGKSSTMSGIFNSAIYSGSAISTYGTAAIAVEHGWKFVTGVWVIAVLAALTLCLLWNKKYEKIKE